MSESNKPNILFLMTDQQRNDTFSCINPEVVTPHMDQLIADSVFFSNARCANPSCVPSRAAIMTGKFPSECECPTFITHLPAHETTFMSRLQEAGYHTAVIGKQHFAGSPIKRGYDEEMIIDGHSALYPDDTIQPYLDYLTENGIDRKHVMSKTLISGGTWEVDTKYHLDDYIGELGKAWMKKKGAAKDECDKPWFLTLSFSGPHHPYDCEGTEFAELYDYEKLSVPKTSYADLDEKPPHFKQMGSYADIYLKHFSEETFKKTKRSYYANISLIDQKVGELIRIMKENHLYDNTLIIYTSDHGDFMGDFGMVEKLQCLSDSLMRVPLFIKPPIQGFSGFEVKDDVLNIDIAATCLEVAGAEVPASLSNYPYTCYWDDSKQKKVRDAIYMEAGSIRGCIHQGIKTVHYLDRSYGELYDLNKDPQESHNLWNDPEYTEHKLEGYRIIVNHMYRAIPKSDIPWNVGTPDI
ncbi:MULTISPECIES: sulfatase family protein [Paenibacillus]|uniref:sulfatase family protein n=1 Tax=Paenibacillus TaxID=44249 RepID=UPI0001AFD8E4|nr:MULTISPECIES: sulfatase-like hydrolase/transferase [unclassified Paenibacillus]EES72560.1 arylsulfatase [Paenibacillus sp. oral taxon 786 str. D14]OXL87531.1 sulfatase [Paenibacillus sp. SSG-1]